MIFVRRPNDASISVFESASEALRHVSSEGWNPGVLSIWRNEHPLVLIDFEELNEMAGRNSVDIGVVRAEVSALCSAMDERLRTSLGWRMEVVDSQVSTSGIVSSSDRVRRFLGNPMAKLMILSEMDDHLAGEAPRLTADRLRGVIDDVESDGAPLGWDVLISSVSGVSVETKVPGRRFRRHEVVLVKMRDGFREGI